MAREPEWKREIRSAMRSEPRHLGWTLSGPNRLVKVVRPGALMNTPPTARAVGYVTQEKYLLGLTPAEIERRLGLPPFHLFRGCRVFRLARLPQASEYTDELSAAEPDGLAFDVSQAWEARARFVTEPTLTEVPYYPPGDPVVPQWRVSIAIPLVHIIDLPPLFHYPRHTA